MIIAVTGVGAMPCFITVIITMFVSVIIFCLLYTSDAADE